MSWNKIIVFLVSSSFQDCYLLLAYLGLIKFFLCEDVLPFATVKFSRLALIFPKNFMLVQFVQFCQYRLYLYKPDFIRTFFDCKIILCWEDLDICRISCNYINWVYCNWFADKKSCDYLICPLIEYQSFLSLYLSWGADARAGLGVAELSPATYRI